MGSILRRMWAHITGHRLIYFLSLSGVLALALLAVFATNDTPPSPAAALTPIERNAGVAANLSASLLPGDDVSTSDGDPKIDVQASTAYIGGVKSANPDLIVAPVINANTLTTVYTSLASGVPVTVAAHYLPEQTNEILSAFTAKNAAVTTAVTSSTSSTSSVASRFGGNARSSSATGSDNSSQTASFVVLGLLVACVLGTMTWGWYRRSINKREQQQKDADTAPVTRNSSGDTVEVPDVTFADVAGAEEAVEDLAELVAFLKNPEQFDRMGAKTPKGALLVGPPGTGKTLLARAVAGEAEVPFYTASGSDFVEMYVGVGPKRVRELFKKARQHEDGAIIFIDEFDAVGRKRESAGRSSNQEHEATLNALLVEMDGFHKSKVIVLAATNRDDILDPAILRPGRLDRKIQVPLPDRAGREHILRVHMRDKPVADDVHVSLIARRTPGMSGAELAQLVNEACLQAIREDHHEVAATHFDHAVATVAMGKARTSALVTPNDRNVTAWHEAGHTVSAMVLPDADDPVSVSIIPRGPAGGVTWMASGDDLFLTRKRAFARLVVAMSGRAAEELYLDGEFTSGPHGDLQAATSTAMSMVTQYGMTDVGLMIRSDGLLSTGSRITDATVETVETLLADALAMARDVLATHRQVFDAIVAALLEHETLGYADLETIRAKFDVAPPAMPPAPTEYRKPAAAPSDAVGSRRVADVRVGFSEDRPKRRSRIGSAVAALLAPKSEDAKYPY